MSGPAEIAARIRRWEKEGIQGPMTLEMYPTLRCNLNCGFCDTTERHHPNIDELPAERQLALLEEAHGLGVQRIFILGGGEPLLARSITPHLMRRTKELGMEGILTTNGTLMDAPLRTQILDTAWDEIHFSIDGPTPEIHDALRGVRGAFRKTVSNIRALREERDQRGLSHPRIALHFVLTNQNHHTLSDMVRLGEELGAFRIDFDALIAYRPEQLEYQLTEAQRAEVPSHTRAALKLAEELGIATTLERFLEPENLKRGEREIPLPEGEGLAAAPCLKAWHYLVVQSDGKTSPCCVLAGEGESVRDTDLKTLWRDSPFLNKVREGMISGNPMARCRECSGNILAHEAVIRSHL
jgi:MoaA/NifB/PqqE/SkfB family radical SAM enzyme